MNEIARNYNDDLTKRSFNTKTPSHMTQQVKKKNKCSNNNKKNNSK